MNRTNSSPIQDKSIRNGSPESPIICVVDDDNAVLRSIEFALAGMGFQVNSYTSAEEFQGAHSPGDVACLVLDYVLPGASGLELLTQLKQFPELQVVMISGKGTIATAVSAMKSGAIEFLEKPYSAESLRVAVRNAVETYRKYQARHANVQARQEQWERLNEGERQVINASATGETVKQIASQLDISVRTVHMRLSSAMKKTGTSNKIELIKLLYLANQAPN